MWAREGMRGKNVPNKFLFALRGWNTCSQSGSCRIKQMLKLSHLDSFSEQPRFESGHCLSACTIMY
jgi:hypothetical protein